MHVYNIDREIVDIKRKYNYIYVPERLPAAVLTLISGPRRVQMGEDSDQTPLS